MSRTAGTRRAVMVRHPQGREVYGHLDESGRPLYWKSVEVAFEKTGWNYWICARDPQNLESDLLVVEQCDIAPWQRNRYWLKVVEEEDEATDHS